MVERNERPELDVKNHRLENRRLEERRIENRRQMHRRKSSRTMTIVKYLALLLLIAAFIAAFSV
jgi:hypothetical protein